MPATSAPCDRLGERAQLRRVLDARRGLGPARDVDGERLRRARSPRRRSPAVRPPDRISGTVGAAQAAPAPSRSVSPVPPKWPARCVSSRWKSVWKASIACTSEPAATRAALMIFAPVRRATSAQNDGPSSPCSCTSDSPIPSASPQTSSSGWLTNTPADLGLAAQRAGDPRGLAGIAVARGARPEDRPERPRARLDREAGVIEAGDAAELDARTGHPSIVRSVRSGLRACLSRSAPGWTGRRSRARPALAERDLDGPASCGRARTRP